ncbi:fibrinogen-like protein 1 isoform X1 [Myiozetetes cayanensis]|uniref:fibrinogen-like protein 1 isoform X1 n=1 Tax=Myiozetetes cayanensis TaxID=478635 RepID=UPI00215DD8CB|nr:fibrinogen-like protein 1 isoform X1 [Myiozetetes cayanensis]XP_050189295.1 fibrinogen-like protein 1 isoform X1 [Myiozetetes cayanensis]
MMHRLLLLLLLVSFSSPAPRFSDKDVCLQDNNKLRQRLKQLQDLLYLYDLQLKDILENTYHRTRSGLFSGNRSVQHETLLPTTSGNLIVYDQDCSAVYNRKKTKSGYYRIRPRADREPFLVYCDMFDGGGWTVIQRRSNGRENFNRKWDDYKLGFGRFQGKNDEYWLGNDHIYDLLARGESSLKIELMDWHGERRYAVYENFQLANEQDNYRLWFGTYSGNAGDALSGGSNFEDQWSASHRGMQFTTFDKDHDRFLAGNCASENKGGWWFNRCHAVNLNGRYYRGGRYKGSHDDGMVWSTWHGMWYSLKYSAMKIRAPFFVDSESGDGENSQGS